MDNNDPDPAADRHTAHPIDLAADPRAHPNPRRRVLLVALATLAACAAAAGVFVVRRASPDASVFRSAIHGNAPAATGSPVTGAGPSSNALPSWAVGRFYIPSRGFMAMAMSDRYGEGRRILGPSGKWMASVAAASPEWYPDSADDSRPVDENDMHVGLGVWHWMTTTLTVRSADGNVVAESDTSGPLEGRSMYSLNLPRSALASPLSITADDGTERQTIPLPVRSVTDGTAIRSHSLQSAATREGLTLRVTDAAAWPGGIALRLEGATGAPTDRVVVTAARFTGGNPTTVILSPHIVLRDDRGRTYPLLAAEAYERPNHAFWGPGSRVEEDTFAGEGPPTASIGLPATLRFAPLAADARDVSLEVADAFVILDSEGMSARGLARLVPASGTLLAFTPPQSLDAFPRATRPAHLADRYWTGGLPVVPVDRPITIGGVRTRVASARVRQEPNEAEGGSAPGHVEVVSLNLEPPPTGSKRFVLDSEAWAVIQPSGRVRCEASGSGHGYHTSPTGDLWIQWPPTIEVHQGSDARYPPQRRVRICVVNPLIAVHDTWTLPLPGGLLVADQEANGTGSGSVR